MQRNPALPSALNAVKGVREFTFALVERTAFVLLDRLGARGGTGSLTEMLAAVVLASDTVAARALAARHDVPSADVLARTARRSSTRRSSKSNRSSATASATSRSTSTTSGLHEVQIHQPTGVAFAPALRSIPLEELARVVAA